MKNINLLDVTTLPWRKNVKNENFDLKLVQEFVSSLGVIINHSGNKPHYVLPSPRQGFPNHMSGDYIRIPLVEQFISINEYYFALFHELSHWSEIRVKLNLDELQSELVADIVSCFLCNKFKIKQNNFINYNFYLNKWIENIKLYPLLIKDSIKYSHKIKRFLLKCQNNNHLSGSKK